MPNVLPGERGGYIPDPNPMGSPEPTRAERLSLARLAAGEASAEEQKIALAYIVYAAGALLAPPHVVFDPGRDERINACWQGRLGVGRTIYQAIHLPIRASDYDDGERTT